MYFNCLCFLYFIGHDDSDEPATGQWQSSTPAPVVRHSWYQHQSAKDAPKAGWRDGSKGVLQGDWKNVPAYLPQKEQKSRPAQATRTEWETRPANIPQGHWRNEQNKPIPQGAWRSSRPANNPQSEEWRPTSSSVQDEWRRKLANGPRTEWRGKPQAEWRSKQTSVPQGDWRSKKSDHGGPQQDWQRKPANVPQSRPTSAPQTEQKSKSPSSWSVHGYGPVKGAVRPLTSSSMGSWAKDSQTFLSSGTYRSTLSKPALGKPQGPKTQRFGPASSSSPLSTTRPLSTNSGPNLPPWAGRNQKTQSQGGSVSWKQPALSQTVSAQGQRQPSRVSGGNYNRGQNTAPTSSRWTQQSQDDDEDDDDDEDVKHVPVPAGQGQGTLVRKRW